MDIHTFINQTRQGYARPNKYKVEIALPIGAFGVFGSTGLDKTIDDFISTSAIGGAAGALTGTLKSFVNIPSVKDFVSFGLTKAGISTVNICLNCESTQLPGIAFTQSERTTYGPVIKYPHKASYIEQPLGFYCSEDMRERIFFDLWFSMMMNRDSHDINFYNEYKSTVYVSQLDYNSEKTMYRVKFEDAYPASMTPIELGYANDNQVQRFTVQFNYSSWKPILVDPIDGSFNLNTVVKTITS